MYCSQVEPEPLAPAFDLRRMGLSEVELVRAEKHTRTRPVTPILDFAVKCVALCRVPRADVAC